MTISQSPTGSTIADFPTEDADVGADLHAVRRAFHDGRVSVERALYALELKLAARLTDLRAQAASVADANVRAVEIVAAQKDLSTRLDVQNRDLLEQNARIEAQRVELEQQTKRLAGANVEALFLVEASEAKLRQVGDARERLSDVNKLLAGRAREIEEQALALADSNVAAVVMLDEREQRLAEACRRFDALSATARELEGKAFVDVLTGLFNHRYFREQMAFELARARRYARQLSVVFLDIDRFKQLNDTHGHRAGNEVLAEVGRRLADEVRGADIPIRMDGVPFAARYGGEEFVVILPETDAKGAETAAERLRALIAGTAVEVGGESIWVTVSAGVAALREQDEGLDALVARADQALYGAKRAGRNRVMVAAAEE
jgi:diguanylate cyclase (GGDEF)-like protein